MIPVDPRDPWPDRIVNIVFCVLYAMVGCMFAGWIYLTILLIQLLAQ